MKETRFKNTELGPIPVDWEVATLGEVGTIAMCKRVFKEQTHTHGDVPFFKIGTFGSTADAFISRELFGFLKNEYRFPSKGDLLISAAGTIGRVVEYNGDDAYFQDSNIIWLEHDESKVLNKYLKHLFKVVKWQTENGGIVTRLYNSNFNATNIAIPPIMEQEKIAEALSDVDALIAELGELIEKKRLVKQGTMQQLLTAKRRLPGFSKPWVEHRLGDIGVFSKGKGISKAETTSEGLPCIRYGEIYTNHHDYIKSFVSYISQQTAMDSVALRKGQILFTASGETKEEIGKAVAFNLDLEAYAGGDIIIFTPTIQCDPIFMGYVMNTPDVNSQKSALGQGDAVVHIGAVALSTISVFIPDISEQRAIAEILTDMDNEIAELEAKREKYRAIKEGMMQQLLTGRIRLIDSTASSRTIDPSASINSDGDTPAAHTPPITYEPSTSYPQSLAAEPTILD